MLNQLGTANVLVLDSGNALFRNAGVSTPEDEKRASFVLGVMEELGTRAMAVGQRDLSAGTAFLEKLAKGRKVKLLSANLTRGGKRVFDGAVVIDAGGVKVGLIGLTAPGPVAPNEKDVVAGPTLEAARAALKELGPRDVTIVLAATSYADSMQLSVELRKDVDFVIQSGEYRGTQPAQRVDDTAALLLASGQKGQALGKLKLSLGKGQGAFVDASVVERDKAQLDFVGQQIKTLEDRRKLAKDAASKAQFDTTLSEFKRRQKDLATAVAARVSPSAKTALLEWVVLGQDVADDPKLKAKVLEIEPSYSGSH